ncbi:CcmD family protein [Chitinophaga pendula]|uniref:CcmD family protein n=1 Tax=Chitinophaga TaxID=79328 RepID=UPI000BB09B91|nr:MULTISPECIES: CcmD family protein [Chitinophaga]ASZ11158.1 CcmD family protein [Chitinophaga sp. MD30]UCJ05846.1 CcmD family protein [Chitinophaga pendula]
MINRASYFLLTLVFTLCSLLVQAQQQNTETGPVNEMFRSNGKIYVVVAVLLIIFIGIIIYLVQLDRKISKLEKRSQH